MEESLKLASPKSQKWFGHMIDERREDPCSSFTYSNSGILSTCKPIPFPFLQLCKIAFYKLADRCLFLVVCMPENCLLFMMLLLSELIYNLILPDVFDFASSRSGASVRSESSKTYLVPFRGLPPLHGVLGRSLSTRDQCRQ